MKAKMESSDSDSDSDSHSLSSRRGAAAAAAAAAAADSDSDSDSDSAPAGRVKMPYVPRGGSLRTTDVWSKTIGYDPYAAGTHTAAPTYCYPLCVQ
jgi:hypothetical protein